MPPPNLRTFLWKLVIGERREPFMSDIAPDPTTVPPAAEAAPVPAPADPAAASSPDASVVPIAAPAPPPAVDLGPLTARLDSLEQQLAALEQRVTALEQWPAPTFTTSGAVTITTPATSPAAIGNGFDAEARRQELLAQGLSEADANEQAAYEERLWNDAHTPPSAAG